MTRLLTTKRMMTLIGVIAGLWLFSVFTGGETAGQPNPMLMQSTQQADSTVTPTQAEQSVAAEPEQGAPPGAEDEGATEEKKEVSEVLLGLIIILLAAKIGGDIVERFNQPAVLGELIFGIIIGNLTLVGIDVFEPFKHSLSLEVLAEIGVIILLFQVGLESSLGEMMKVGVTSFMVATFGVITPFFLGYGVSVWFLPQESIYVHIFIGATLTATSVGITARVLQDMKKIQTAEAKIILGAAVIDDIMGLVILAVVMGIISAAAGGAGLSAGGVFWIVAKAVGFVVGAIFIGHLLAPRIFVVGSKMRVKGVLLAIALMICFTLAFIADQIDLAPIVGAFAAGLILDEIHFKPFRDTKKEERSVDEMIEPIATFLVPIFFVRMGMLVELRTFGHMEILAFAGVMTLAAILGKQACSLAIFTKGINRVAIGLGMIPRGEVGLIFAGIGAKLYLYNEPVISGGTFSAVVIMVIVTTLVTPPVLKWSMLRGAPPPDEIPGL
jgi:Kef-type K+ transport system membrane component KefB